MGILKRLGGNWCRDYCRDEAEDFTGITLVIQYRVPK